MGWTVTPNFVECKIFLRLPFWVPLPGGVIGYLKPTTVYLKTTPLPPSRCWGVFEQYGYSWRVVFLCMYICGWFKNWWCSEQNSVHVLGMEPFPRFGGWGVHFRTVRKSCKDRAIPCKLIRFRYSSVVGCENTSFSPMLFERKNHERTFPDLFGASLWQLCWQHEQSFGNCRSL